MIFDAEREELAGGGGRVWADACEIMSGPLMAASEGST